MKLIENIKKYFLICTLFIIIIITYNSRFEIIFKTFSMLGYDESLARKYSFSISERPFQIIKNKFNNIFYSLKQKREQLNVSLMIKKGFANYNSPNLEFKDGNYYLNIIDSSDIDQAKQKLEYSNIWKNKMPSKIWSLNMSNKTLLDQNSDQESVPMIVEATPQICGTKLIYAKQDGNIGAVDYRSGKRLWYNKYGNLSSTGWPRMRGFLCKYDKDLDTNIILLPTAEGVFCINSYDGSILNSRCGGGKLGEYESRVSPQLFNNTVYIATINPSGIEAYDFLSGKLLWHKDLAGANPWNNFVIDQERQLIFVNMGSPSDWSIVNNSKKYEYSGSLIALNSKNGKIAWQFQEHSKDSWDHDFVGQPILSPRKINGKDIVITFSKSGSIYFLKRDNGLPVLSIKEEIIDFGDFKYSYKKSIVPKSLSDSNYYNFLGKDCKNCSLNTKIFGPLPPILKLERIFDGHEGGPQWPGASLDTLNNLLILASNHNIIYTIYIDFIPKPLSSLPQNSVIKECVSCHDSKGRIKGFNADDKMIIPSLFLTTKIHDFSSLSSYLKSNNFHKKLKLNNQELKSAYKALNEYDKKLIKNGQYQYISVNDKIDITDKDIYSKSGPLGKITAISIDSGEIVWQIPAGTYKLNDSETIIGSPTFGAITDGGNSEGVSFYTGSLDKKIYAINNNDGKYLWSADLPASGSALPLVLNTPSERWIFVIATGGRILNDQSDSIVAFRQKLLNLN